jgi:outer membrane protein TolC
VFAATRDSIPGILVKLPRAAATTLNDSLRNCPAAAEENDVACLQKWICACLVASWLASGCATSRPAPAQPAPPVASSFASAPRPALPAIPSPLHPAASVQPTQARPSAEIRLVNHEAVQPEPLPAQLQSAQPAPMSPQSVHIGPAMPSYPIDLPTALRLADADHVQVALAREQVQQAYAEYRQAGVLWLPSLRAGVHWNHHEGTLLSSSGLLRDLTRSSLYAGAGAVAVGGGSPAVPGIFANFHLADALFQPLAAQQRWGAREQAATAARNNALLDVSLAYLELLRSAQDIAITHDLHEKTQEIWRLTDAFVRTGQSPQSDVDRMRVEVGLREIDSRRAHEALALASARLTQLLRLEPCLRLEPVEPAIVPLCLIRKDRECLDLVTQALSNRPELTQSRYLVGEAVQRMHREQWAPLVPSLVLGASYGGFGGGLGSDVNPFQDRLDLDATAFWEIRNLGLGESAIRQGANSRLRQAQLQEIATLDQVAREVTEAHAQLQLRELQLNTARDVLRFASESYEHNLVRIRGGQGLPIEVLQSVQALLQARREYLRSVIDYNSTQFTLQRALGWPIGDAAPALEQPAASE